MADEGEAILRALNGLMGGIRSGLETRRNNQLEQQKLQLQSEELTLRHQEREVSSENNRIYREQLMNQRGVDTQVRKSLGEGELRVKGSKEAGDQEREVDQTIASIEEKRRKITEQRRKLSKGLAGLGEPVEGESPRKKARRDYFAQELSSIDEDDSRLQAEIDKANSRRPGAKTQQKAPPADPISDVEKVVQAGDFATGKAAFDAALKDGTIKPGSPAIQRIVDELRRKQTASRRGAISQ